MVDQSRVRDGRQHGIPASFRTNPMGHGVGLLRRLSSSDLLDRVGLRRRAEGWVNRGTRTAFTASSTIARRFASRGRRGSAGARPRAHAPGDVFDLNPTDDEQMLVEVSRDLAAEVLRPLAADADTAARFPDEVAAAAQELGLGLLGVPESMGGLLEERSAMATTLVAEALAHGDMGLALAALAPGSVATALSLWGDEAQQQTYLPAFAEAGPPVAALCLTEPRVLADPLLPTTTAVPDPEHAGGHLLTGTKSAVVRGAAAELLVVSATLDGRGALFLVESGPTVTVHPDPAMGLRAAELARVTLDRTPGTLLGSTDDTSLRECLRLSRIGWCALAVGTSQAALDHVTGYVNEREAFGEPISHRQGVAFTVADMAIELQAMRLLTHRAASRAARGDDVARDVALARQACATHGMRIASDAVQMLGGHGFVKEHPVERWYRDLRAVAVLEGGVLV